MTEALPFADLPAPPASLDAVAMLRRLVQAVGFRYYHATDSLDNELGSFSPGHGHMDVDALLAHLLALAKRVATTLGATASDPSGSDLISRRAATLRTLAASDQHLAEMTGPALLRIPDLGYLINGPLADMLSHIGQLNTLRRLQDRPVARVDWFHGQQRRG